MNSFKDHLMSYVKKELELTGFSDTNFEKNVISLLEELSNLTGDDSRTMKQLCEWLPRLIDRIPISPITEDDFQPEYHGNDNSIVVMRCTRYPYVYKSSDGKYWNDRAVAFKFKNTPDSDIMFLYKPNGSKREITLPYYPNTVIEIIDAEQS